ncbi:MAG: hypothetical protein WB777_14320 [Mycobacterium sp.]
MTKFWLKVPVKIREQAVRAARLFLVTLAGSLVTLQGKHVDASVIVSVVVAAVEVTYRQLVPVTPVKVAVQAVQPPVAGTVPQ